MLSGTGDVVKGSALFDHPLAATRDVAGRDVQERGLVLSGDSERLEGALHVGLERLLERRVGVGDAREVDDGVDPAQGLPRLFRRAETRSREVSREHADPRLDALREAVASIDPDSLTPRRALELLYDLRSLL